MLLSKRGFTLIEMMVALTIMAMLMLALLPFASDWVYSSQTREARAKLVLAYGHAKAVALRNPESARDSDAAGSLLIASDGTTTTLYACAGASTGTGCAANGTALHWSSSFTSSVATTVNDVTLTASQPIRIDLSNRSEGGSPGSFVLSRGSASNEETGTLN